jgi:aryl-alcohol dehydrogenase-like predicted oxidoreductase
VASANRLGVRRLDLYQVHQPDPVVRDGTIMRGMRALQRVGLVGEVGVSNYSLARWRAAEAALGSRVLTNQVSYSLVDRSPAVVAIPGASSVEQLESNVAAADIELSDEQVRALSSAADRFRPITGAAAVPRMIGARLPRARLGSRSS